MSELVFPSEHFWTCVPNHKKWYISTETDTIEAWSTSCCTIACGRYSLEGGGDELLVMQARTHSATSSLHNITAAEANCRHRELGYPLQYVVQSRAHHLARCLLLKGARVNQRQNNFIYGGFTTPLHSAVRTYNEQMVLLLFEHGADANAQWDRTPLMALCSNMKVEANGANRQAAYRIFDALVENGADVNGVDVLIR